MRVNTTHKGMSAVSKDLYVLKGETREKEAHTSRECKEEGAGGAVEENEWGEGQKGSADEHRCHVGLVLGLLRAFRRPGLFDLGASFLLQRHQLFLIEASLEEQALPINSGVRTMAIHTEER